ncbi:MAG: hypothetical protein JWQ38_895 [Flavipsychrobacter sp.]|nr:hypothetical protein [Flavipsychrobacter sp.]
MNVNGLNADIAKTLIKNYTDNHLAVINSSTALTALRQPDSPSDSRCVWYSLDTLKRFISEIESNTYVKCNDISGDLGIRFYYGEYPAPDSELWGTPSMPVEYEPYAGMHTLMLTPTYNDGTKNVDFDPTFAHMNGTPVPITEVFTMVGPAPLPSTNVLMMNHGHLTPPPFPTTGIYGPTTGAYMLDIANAPIHTP